MHPLVLYPSANSDAPDHFWSSKEEGIVGLVAELKREDRTPVVECAAVANNEYEK